MVIRPCGYALWQAVQDFFNARLKKIGVLMGGLSAERDISLQSGENVLKALLEGEPFAEGSVSRAP